MRPLEQEDETSRKHITLETCQSLPQLVKNFKTEMMLSKAFKARDYDVGNEQ
jgi:hypothetical protein